MRFLQFLLPVLLLIFGATSPPANAQTVSKRLYGIGITRYEVKITAAELAALATDSVATFTLFECPARELPVAFGYYVKTGFGASGLDSVFMSVVPNDLVTSFTTFVSTKIDSGGTFYSHEPIATEFKRQVTVTSTNNTVRGRVTLRGANLSALVNGEAYYYVYTWSQ